MSDHREMLFRVWQEACRHIEIQESTESNVALLRAHFPVDGIEVLRVERENRLVVRVAVTPQDASHRAAGEQELTEKEFLRVVTWIRRGVVGGGASDHLSPLPLAALGLNSAGRDVRLAPLQHGADSLGILVLWATPGTEFTRPDADMIRALMEPFSAALANDRRLHELAALREAAEADRRSLLRRLGRTDITDRIVGADSGLSQVMKRVELVSRSDAPVLLLGETGTGKEVVARTVHERSGRRDGPFIRVNCGAIPTELVDSQLFGHEKGAFTGAVEMRRGWFERADRGTLFLDEIGELPPNAQVRFLRVLQDAFIERVGGVDPIHVDVRVIAATHRDLAAMVQEGRFREDLWYRIAVFLIRLPPLRERLEDIAVLAEHLAERAAHRFGLTFVAPSAADIELLRRYAWPGNIRELATVIDRAAILGEGRTLQIESALGAPAAASTTARVAPTPRESAGVASLDDVMRQHIEATLRFTKGRIEGSGGAAALLRINPHTLRARMRKLGVVWSRFRVAD
jgi:transcriptional regulator with GAF, ATPase, and Fis domain